MEKNGQNTSQDKHLQIPKKFNFAVDPSVLGIYDNIDFMAE